MPNKSWSYLQPGDIVDVIAPASIGKPAVIAKAKALLTSWGLRYNIPENIFGEDLLCANSDPVRFKQLKAALLNKKSKAVWCLRGGYGCARLIPMLEKLTPPAHNKLFMGFSDVTVLHAFLQKQWRWATVHGPSLNQCVTKDVAESSVQKLKAIVFGEQQQVDFNLTPLNKLANKKIAIQSSVVGGNLCLLQHSINTVWQPNTKNKIVFLEEVGERGYRVDRMLVHLQQAGLFKQIKGLVLGDFTDGLEPGGKSLVPAVIKRFAEQCDFPVLQVSGIGHGKTNDPIPLGTKIILQLGDEPVLNCETGGRFL
jgi:muramoyltetrapeptide carboxypeptidase